VSSKKECRRCETALPDAAQFCFLCGREVGDETPRDANASLRARLEHILDGRYRVREVLGVGGMGVVFLADDIGLDRTVAIKVLQPELAGDENVVSRFRREAKTAARLDHPGIVPIYRVESEGGLHYFAMKYVAGRSLEEVLRIDAPVSIPFATRVLREAAAALAHAHRHGVVHRDVKPDNIMLDANGSVLLADFGISKASSGTSGATTVARLTESGGVVGTPHYMAPEHALGQAVDGRTDQYALGVVGFEMLTGRVPFDEETPHAIIHLHINEAPPRLATLRPDVPAYLAGAIARAMSKAPAHRFATMEEFAAALESTEPLGKRGGGAPTRVLAPDDGELDRALDRTFAEHQPAPKRRRVSWLAVAILIVMGLGGTAAWVGGVGRHPSRGAPERARTSASKPPVEAPVAEQAGSVRAPRPAEPRRRTALLNVVSSPRAVLFVDGKRVGETPITEQALTVGRKYQIWLERKGYRTKRETITVSSTATIRRRYSLERESRR
jgi:predicted Ser/Thr protein kinase